MDATRTFFAAVLLIVAVGCGERSAIDDPHSCDPGTTRYVCRYFILYDDPKGGGGECYFPSLDVCAPMNNDASLYEQRVTADDLGSQAYGDIPWGPGLVGRFIDCQTPDMAPTPDGVPCAEVPH